MVALLKLLQGMLYKLFSTLSFFALPILLLAQTPVDIKNEQLVFERKGKSIAPAYKAGFTIPDPTPEPNWDPSLVNFGQVHAPKKENLSAFQLEKQEAMELKGQQIPFNGETQLLNDTIGLKIEKRFRVNLTSSIPPDNTAAISNNGHIVSVVNSNICFAQEDGSISISNQSLTTFYEPIISDISTFIFDPKVLYDPEADRFILVLLSGNNSATSNLIVSFSTSSDPLEAWNHYIVDGDPSDKDIWTDFPSIGLSSEDFFMSGNLFSDNNGFAETVLWQMDKDAGYAGEDEIEMVVYEDVSITNGNNAFTLKPTVNSSSEPYGPNFYLVSNRWGGGGSMYIYEVNDQVENSPTLSVFNVTGEQNFSGPPNGDQLGSSKVMDTGDIRVKSAFVQNNKVFVAFSSNSPTGHAGIYLAKISLDDFSAETEIFTESGYDWGHPSIAPFGYDETDETILVGFLRTNSTIYPEMRAFAVDENMNATPSVLIKSGESPITVLDGDNQRWGDYSFAFKRFNADTPTVWFTGCYGLNFAYGNFISEIKRVANMGAISADFTATPTSGFKPLVVNFEDNSTGEDLSYFWEFEFGEPAYSTEQNPVVTYDQLGNFNVKLTINNGQDAQIIKEEYIEVLPEGIPPIADFTSDVTTGIAPLTVQFTDLSLNEPTELLWQFFGGSPGTSTVSNPVVTYNNPGTYKVRLSAENEAGFDTKIVNGYIIVEDPTNTSTLNDDLTGTSIFPNPVSERFMVEFHLKERMLISIDILDQTGRQVNHFFKEYAKAGRNQFSFSTAPLSTGMYYINISDKNGVVLTSKKILIQ